MANPVVFFDIAANSEPLGRVTFEVGAGGGRGGLGGAAAISLPGARGRWGAGKRRACAAGVRWWLRGPRPGGANKGPRASRSDGSRSGSAVPAQGVPSPEGIRTHLVRCRWFPVAAGLATAVFPQIGRAHV